MMTDEEYTAKGGQHCPFCNSENISLNGTFDPESGTIEVECDDCERQWFDYYELKGWVAR